MDLHLAANSSMSDGTGAEENERDNISISSSDSSSLSFLLSNFNKGPSAAALPPQRYHQEQHEPPQPSPRMERSSRKMSNAVRTSEGITTGGPESHRQGFLSEAALEDEFLKELQVLLSGTASTQGQSSLHTVDDDPSAGFIISNADTWTGAVHDTPRHHHQQGSLISPPEQSNLKDDGCNGGAGGPWVRRQAAAHSAEMTPSRSHQAAAAEFPPSNAALVAEGQQALGPVTPSSSIEVASSLLAMLSQSGDHQ